MKKIFLCFFFIFLGISYGQTRCQLPTIPKNPNAEQIMKVWFDLKYKRFAHDYNLSGEVVMIDKTGFKRRKRYIRKRILLHGKGGIDYKDLVSVTYPEYTKGLAVLTWAYTDPKKQHDIWIWLPSFKKIRKVSQAEEDDSFMGSEYTIEEVSTRRFGYENYKLLGEEAFSGYKAIYTNEVYYKGLPCYKIEATPKRKHWYYSKRIVWLDKKTGFAIFDEYYNPRGKVFKTLFRHFRIFKDGCLSDDLWEVKNLRTGHSDIVLFKDISFNKGIDERLFTEKTLERMPW